MMTTGTLCFHCGLETRHPLLGTIDGQEREFCCSGCRTVCEIIHTQGLESYYDKRGEAKSGRAAPGAPEFPFDHEDFQRQYVHQDGASCQVSLMIDGMHCAACVWLIEKGLARHPGLQDVQVSLGTQRAHLRWDPAATKLSELAGAIAQLGYRPFPYDPSKLDQPLKARNRDLLLRMGVAGLGTLATMYLAEPLYFSDFTGDEGFQKLLVWLALMIATPTSLYAFMPILKGAWSGLRQKTINMDGTIALGALGTYFASVWGTITGGPIYFESLTMFLFLILTGRFVEGTVRRKVFSATERLLKLEAKAATVIQDGEPKRVPLQAVRVGDLVAVSAGEAIPVDGVIQEGTAGVNEAMLTGESRPVLKQPGDRVLGSSVAVDGSLVVKATGVGHETQLNQIIRLIEQADSHRSPGARRIDQITNAFGLSVVVVAALAFLVWSLLADPSTALMIAVAVLVITCPCALGLAIPAANVLSATKGVDQGILFADGAALEALPGVTHVVLDKTGTVTTGHMEVATLVPFKGGEADLLALAAALEERFEHPIARAIKALSQKRGLALPPVENFQVVAGRGVLGRVPGGHAAIGSEALLESQGIPLSAASRHSAEVLKSRGLTVAFVGLDGEVVGVLGLRDELREDAPATVRALRAQGIHVTLLSGDHRQAAELAGKALGVDRILSEVMPDQKQQVIRNLQAPDRVVVMVGDGVNDAPALAQADVGMAMGEGTDLSITSAKVILLGNRLDLVIRALGLAKETQRIIRQNLILSAIYNVLTIPLAVAGLVTPLFAAIVMPLSSLAVIGNSLRLTRKET
ncbi:putative copper-exporting P-type ATPase V [compost metagenome]